MIIRYRGKVRRSSCGAPLLDPLPDCTRTGTPKADHIHGSRLPDWVCAGAGRDVIRAGGGGPDTVKCGSGRDRVYADRSDRLASCEEVVR